MPALLSSIAFFLTLGGMVPAATPPVTALAYRPDGNQLAVGLRSEVVLLGSDSGAVQARLPNLGGQVTALAWSHKGERLAVASGVPGKSGEVRVYSFPPRGRASMQPDFALSAHADIIPTLAFSPDGKLLATGSYDRRIRLWDTKGDPDPLRELKDHSDSVYALAFRPDGKLLASAAADRTVKLWNVGTGVRLFSLNDPTDWVYAVAWSPDGSRLAAGGVDKSIRTWAVNEQEGRLLRSAFAHEKAVLNLAFGPDGQTLVSTGEDRRVKVWNAGELSERLVAPSQAESILTGALRPDGKQLALGRYDGAVVLIDTATGKTTAQPLPEKPKPPKANSIMPVAIPRGAKGVIALDGENLDGPIEVVASLPAIKATASGERTANRINVLLDVPAGVEPGSIQLRLKTPGGESSPIALFVDRFPAKPEPAGSESPRRSAEASWNTTFAGSLARTGEVDYYRIQLDAPRELGVQVQAMPGGKLESVLILEDANGRVLAETANGLLGVRLDAGAYVLALRDREFRGGGEFQYRLHLGDVPIVTSVFPLGVPRGFETRVQLNGVHLGAERSVMVKVPADGGIGTKVAVPAVSPLGRPLGEATVVVGEFREVSAVANDLLEIPTPGTGNGRISQPGTTQTWRIRARKGEPLVLEIHARRIGSPLDSTIEILDAQGKPVERAVLRSLAQTFVTFRDHDSAGSGIRMDAWNEFAIDDYVLVGQELMRIRALPRNPDDDCQFYAPGGQRQGWLGTTPSHHAQGTPMYRVAVHPAGAQFPSNGMPLVRLTYRNDDGGAGFGKDSRLRFDPKADGEYLVRVRDARGQGGIDYSYRLTARAPRPDFAVRFAPTAPAVWKGGSVPITVTADRLDDFDGPIQVRLDNLPPGFSAPPSFIEPGQTTTTFALFAESTAPVPDPNGVPLTLSASAIIGGVDVRHSAAGGRPTLIEPGEIVTTTGQSAITIRPGQESKLMVHVERRNGFKGRIPIEVQGLPHGVRVLNVGLNGILVTERDINREIVIYAEPWVKAMEHPFVVLAKREGKNTEHGARSVLLRVAP